MQVLFAFLLTVPFTQRFASLTETQEEVYYATLLATAAAALLLIAPSAHHRINFRQQDKAYIIFLANRLTIAGLAFLAGAMTGVVWLITDLSVRQYRDHCRDHCHRALVRRPLVRRAGRAANSPRRELRLRPGYVRPEYQTPNVRANMPSAGITTVR